MFRVHSVSHRPIRGTTLYTTDIDSAAAGCIVRFIKKSQSQILIKYPVITGISQGWLMDPV